VTVADGANKTVATDGDVGAFLDGVADEQRRRDARLLVDVMREVTGQPAVLWGRAIIGFGSRHLLARLGEHKTGGGCLYLKRVDRADAAALRDIIARSYRAATGAG
jgi:hypothetical protein